ncbi:MAG: M23 family metallopeptidase [Oscillospiraceae bacterium]|nr:M23 family metallopeptidase [Oscillospiraceae bacterium]
MTKRKLKPFVVPVVYVLSLAMLITSVFFIERIINNTVFKSEDIEDVSNTVDEVVEEDTSSEVPVVNTDPQIIRPYVNEAVKVVKNYYDYQADSASQEGSILYYGDTYMQNSGVDYSMDSEFDVVSILDGTVMEVVDDEVMGKTIKIKHSNDLISVYQSMGSVEFKVNDTVTQGTIIGKSGENNVSKDLGNHLHFELYYQGNVVNPENYYGKLLGELS